MRDNTRFKLSYKPQLAQYVHVVIKQWPFKENQCYIENSVFKWFGELWQLYHIGKMCGLNHYSLFHNLPIEHSFLSALFLCPILVRRENDLNNVLLLSAVYYRHYMLFYYTFSRFWQSTRLCIVLENKNAYLFFYSLSVGLYISLWGSVMTYCIYTLHHWKRVLGLKLASLLK